jgi:hypothetical protein
LPWLTGFSARSMRCGHRVRIQGVDVSGERVRVD